MSEILVINPNGELAKQFVHQMLRAGKKLALIGTGLEGWNSYPFEKIVHDFSKSRIHLKQSYRWVIHFSEAIHAKTKLNPKANRERIRSATQFAQNVGDSFPRETQFLNIGSALAYAESIVPVTENSPLAGDLWGKIQANEENALRHLQLTAVRVPFVLFRQQPWLEKLVRRTRSFLGIRLGHLNHHSWIHIADLMTNLQSLIESNFEYEIVNLSAGAAPVSNFFDQVSRICNRPLPFKISKSVFSLLNKYEAQVIEKNLQVDSLHEKFSYKFRDLSLALEDCLDYRQTPTLNSRKFHYNLTSFQFIPKSQAEVFEFFKEAQNLERITPDKLNFTILSQSTPQIQEGTQFKYRMKINGFKFGWKTIICNWRPPHQFTDYQKKGPYKVWFHTHNFYEVEGGTLMEDVVLYRLPLSFLGDLAGSRYVKKSIKEIFDYRYQYIEKSYR